VKQKLTVKYNIPAIVKINIGSCVLVIIICEDFNNSIIPIHNTKDVSLKTPKVIPTQVGNETLKAKGEVI
tara:strand:- start:224 stop:433 length:210 start_codon:yes stop_codon:yes gene_type:complete